MNIYLSKNFLRNYRKLLKKNPTSLRLHKLQGKMVTDWSITIEQDLRLIFTYVKDGVLLIDIGKHEDVYRN